MVLDKKGFSLLFKDAADCSKNRDAELEKNLLQFPEEVRKERMEEYQLNRRIMAAKRYEEVEEVPFDMLLRCIKSSDLFADIFEQVCAKRYFESFAHLSQITTCRKKRIL